MLMTEQWSSTCQVCGLALVAPAEVCPRCGTPVLLAGREDSPPESAVPGSSIADELSGPSQEESSAIEPVPERPLNVLLSLAPESSDLGHLGKADELKVDEDLLGENTLQLPVETAQGEMDIAVVSDDALGLAEGQEGLPPQSLAVLSLNSDQLPTQIQGLQPPPGSGAEVPDTLLARRMKRVTRLARWFSVPVMAGFAFMLVLTFALLFITARSATTSGLIAPDWGLASLRIGVAAGVVGGLLLISCLVVWRLQKRSAPLYGGVFALLLVLVGAGGILSAAPLRRLQGRWFEGQGQYGLAIAAYQLSGDTLATSQDMARISIEWAGQLSGQHDYSDAITQLEAVARDYKADNALGEQARLGLIQDYLAWGDQAQQQQAFNNALARYQALQKASYCTASCQMQVHTHAAQALLGLAQQLVVRQQYDAALAAYQQLALNYSDTSEGQEAEQAITAAQPVMGYLVYGDKTPAAHFQVLLASRWTFDTTTQVFTLLGLQYAALTDTTGLFMIPSVMVGNTYLVAWIDSSGHGGTCKTTDNQPLYIVRVPPLRAADAGVIDVDCV